MTKRQQFKRHPAAIAQDAYGKANPLAFDHTTIGCTNIYLTNRIHAAFQAGWDAAMKHMEKSKAKVKP